MISSSDGTAVSGSTFQGEALMRRHAHERRVRCGDGSNGVEPALPLCAQTVEWTCLDGMHACALPRVGTRLSNGAVHSQSMCAQPSHPTGSHQATRSLPAMTLRAGEACMWNPAPPSS